MAKSTNVKQRKKNGRGSSNGLEPRPSYETLMGEIDRLRTSLSNILTAGKDQDGDLNQVQAAQAKLAVQALNGAAVSFKCPQMLGPYAKGGR